MMNKDDFRQVVAEFYDKWQSSNETAKKLDEVKFYRGIVVGLIIGIVGSLLSSFKTLNNLNLCWYRCCDGFSDDFSAFDFAN